MMEKEFICAFVDPGSHIIDVLCEAKSRVEYCCVPMKFEFNGVTINFYPGQKVSEVYLMFVDKLGDGVKR